MPFPSLYVLRLLVVIVAALAPYCAIAQGNGKTLANTEFAEQLSSDAQIADQQKALDSLSAKTDALEKEIAQGAEDDGKLVDIRLQLVELSREALDSALTFRPLLAEINGHLDRLGAAPAAGEAPELESVANQRRELISEKSRINIVLATAQSLSVRINDLIDKIGAMRSELFRNLLTKRYSLGDALSGKVISDAGTELVRFSSAISSWLSFVFKFKFQAMLLATLMALGAAAVLMIGGRRMFGRVIVADPAIEDPSYLSRLSVAFWSTLLPTASLVVFFAASYFFFDSYHVLRGDIGTFLATLMGLIIIVFSVYRMTNAALSPSAPNWRLIPIESRPARLLVILATAMAVVIGLNNFLSIVNREMSSPLSVTVARSFFATIIVGVIMILMGAIKPFKTHKGVWRPWPAWLRYSAFVLGLFIILAALLGYIGLGMFVALQVVVTGTLLVTAYIGFLSAQAVGGEGEFANSSIGRWLTNNANVKDGMLDQVGLAVSLVLNLMILLVFLPLILLMWGFRPGDIQAWGYKLATGITVGSVTISLTGILVGVVVFTLSFLVTRWFQNWLDSSVMARGKVDAGVRNSIRLVVGYAGIAISALIGISAAGINLSSLALVAGGLSLGIGFGLQNIVSNFVSGLILLAERPFKVGDWVVAGNVSGTVKKISVRATEIETFQRQSVIMPNSELINNAVGNWTHGNKLGRIEIPIGIGYSSDAKKAHEILLEIARSHPLALKHPEPFVLFSGFGDSSLDFEVRVFLSDIGNGVLVQNDIRFAILEAFNNEGIEIPFPQRDLNIKQEVIDKPRPPEDEKAASEAGKSERTSADKASYTANGRRKKSRPDPD